MNGPPDRLWLETDRRPEGVTDATVDAVGRLSEALEWVERARGRLYDFHQMCGHADLLLGDAADRLAEAGATSLAEELRTTLIGRNVIEGRWSFQIVEEYDETYWGPLRTFAQRVRDDLVDGRHHVHESEMKERRRTAGLAHHEQRPEAGR